jgi:triosephosphate isomerase (TIM)
VSPQTPKPMRTETQPASEHRPLVAMSMHMNLTSSEVGSYIDALTPLLANVRGCDVFVLPSFAAIWIARERLRDGPIAWGAQDVHPLDAGGHTGDVSAPMLADLGCRFVMMGHAERRREHRETDALVAAKVAAVLRWGMTPVIMVGEQTAQPVDHVTRFVRRQLARSLATVGGADLGRVVVGYEPVWAIGEGRQAAPPAHVGPVVRAIHEWLTEHGDRGSARVIYGGSVDPDVASGMLAEPGVDGLFVGRFAMDPARFAEVVKIAAAMFSDC